MFANLHQGEIFRAIIRTITIDVMRYFVICQKSAKLLFQYQAVFADIAILGSCRVIGRQNPNIASWLVDVPSTFPVGICWPMSLRIVATNIWHRVSSEIALTTIGLLGYGGTPTATTFTKTAGDFFGIRRVITRTPTGLMAKHILRRMIAMMRLGNNCLPASTGA